MHPMSRRPFIFALLAITSCAARGDNPAEYASGTGELRSLLRGERFFALTSPFVGVITLIHPKTPEDLKTPKTRELRFTHFTYDASKYSEPDQRMPSIPAIFTTSRLKDHGYGTGDFVFSADAIPTVESLAACKTVKELRALIPGLVPAYSEEVPDSVGYWYHFFRLTPANELEVLFLATGAVRKPVSESTPLGEILIWSGRLKRK